MARLTILEFPDPRLRTNAVPVTTFDARLSTLIDDMLETMYEAPGVGLAATQVNEHIQLIVIDVSEEKDAGLHQPVDNGARSGAQRLRRRLPVGAGLL